MGFTYRSASRVRGTRTQLRVMAARGQWFLTEIEELIGLFNFLYTLAAFIAACLTLPCLIAVYFILSNLRRAWLSYLEKKFPALKFVKADTVRSAIDTKRNQGIFTVLLQVRGRCDVETIKNCLQENIIERRNKDGSLSFPHFRSALISKWGHYAWQQTSAFDLDNHLVAGSPLFRGRPVSELNIQEHVSDIVSKYLPPEHSPWQIVVIPNPVSLEERFYLLFRLHHVLLSEQGLSLGDLLLLSPQRPSIFTRRLEEDDENPVEDDGPESSSPLTGLFQQPVAIPRLYHGLRDALTNQWSRFIAAYDPMENPAILKSSPSLPTFGAIFIIASVSIVGQLVKSSTENEDSSFTKLKNVSVIIRNEFDKRHCSLQLLLQGLLTSLYPVYMVTTIVSWLWWLAVIFTLRVPIFLLYEAQALLSRREMYPDAYTRMSYSYIAMVCAAAKESWYVWKIAYTAPRKLLEDLFLSHAGPRHQLQTVSLCGRKVVAWSDPIPVELVHKIRAVTGATTTDILMCATSGALRDYFRQFGLAIPDVVLSTVRYFPHENLLATYRGSEPCNSDSGGVICLALPTRTIPDNDPLEVLKVVQRNLGQARSRQPALYLASTWQADGGLMTELLPSVVTRLLLNYMSRRFAVTVTEVASQSQCGARRHLVCGQEVENLMYWRPPQANISLALTIVNYGSTVRLGVMSDSLLSPQHTVVASGFKQQLTELARAAGVPRDRVHTGSFSSCKTSPRSSSSVSPVQN